MYPKTANRVHIIGDMYPKTANRVHINIQDMKRLIYLIKWLPFALVVLMVLHCLLLLCGIHSNFLAHNGVSPLLYVVMLVLSYKLDFCCFHRLALHYDLAVWCFCWLRDYGILDGFLTPLRVVILSVGIVIISITLTIDILQPLKRVGFLDTSV